MEELVYTILYKKEILSEEKNTYHFTPCYVVKGLYDDKANEFLDEINKSRYKISDPKIIKENCDYCIGKVYTEKELRKKYPNAVSFEQIEVDLFKEDESYMTIGTYDKSKNKISIKKYSYNGLETKDDIEEDSINIGNSIEQKIIMDLNYENIKSECGMDFSLFTDSQIQKILSFNSIEEINEYINLIKNSKNTYQEILEESDGKDKYICIPDNIVDKMLECNSFEEIHGTFKYYDELDPMDLFENDNIAEYDLDDIEVIEDDEIEAEEEIPNILSPGDFENIILETFDNLEKATTLEETKDALYNAFDFYLDNIAIIEFLRENGYNLFKTYHHFVSQTNYINELLKMDDMNKIKREYKLLYIKSKQNIKDVIHELEYDIENTEIEKAYKEANEKLAKLVGLENVKKKLDAVFSSILFKNKTNQSLEFEDNNKHMVFTGNPGTGKTTVAEIIAPLFYKLGYLESDKVAYVAAQDLIAGYVGQTALKTEKLIKANKGGIIVVDEAYILSSPAQQFGNEAITVILKEMEKNKTMFIFAGYQKEMEEFIKMNSGLKSRVNTYIQFDDYSDKELLKMFMNRIKSSNKETTESQEKLSVTPKALKIVKNVIEKGKQEQDFGNGRFVKNIFDIAIITHAQNTKNITDSKKLYKITEKDIPDDILEQILFGENKSSDYGNTTIGFNAAVVKTKGNR